MNIDLYNTSSPPEKVVKTLSNKKTYEGIIFNDTNYLSVESPRVRLDGISDISELANYNYLHINKFKRYYYIVNRYTDKGMIILECESDPLMSFSNDIRNSSQVILRSSKNTNPMLVDNEIAIRSDHSYLYVNFDGSVDTNCAHVILETAGRGGATT